MRYDYKYEYSAEAAAKIMAHLVELGFPADGKLREFLEETIDDAIADKLDASYETSR